jgi:hypothetical protein
VERGPALRWWNGLTARGTIHADAQVQFETAGTNGVSGRSRRVGLLADSSPRQLSSPQSGVS